MLGILRMMEIEMLMVVVMVLALLGAHVLALRQYLVADWKLMARQRWEMP